MKKLYYNPIEVPVEIRLESRILGVKKQYPCHTGEGPVFLEELFKLAATDSFETVEVKLTPHNQAYYRDTRNPLEAVAVDGWISLKEYKNAGGYLKDKLYGI